MLNVVQVINVKASTRIVPECFRMIGNFTQFRATYPRECLARRTTDNNVERVRHGTK